MKKILIAFMIFLVIRSSALANCNWDTGVQKIDATHYSYSLDCHLAVDVLYKQNILKDQQIVDLNKAFTLKDLALQESEKRADMWQATSLKLTDEINKYESLRKSSEIEYYAAGILTVAISAWAIGQVHPR